MKVFDNAYNAASALAEIVEIEVSNPIALAINNLVSIIHNEINAVSFEQIRHDDELQSRLKALSDYGYYISSMSFAISKGELDLNGDHLFAAASVMFRGVSDIQSDLADEERFSWGDMGHWRVLANADRLYRELSDNREAA
jgi:hypothetical protein